MPNFSKFFPAEEGLPFVIYPREAAYKLYIWLLFLLAAFFVMYPLWNSGRPGVLLWLTIIILLLAAIANHFLRRFSYYLLTNTKLWHIFYVSASNIKIRGTIDRQAITDVAKFQDHDIIIFTKKDKYFLRNIRKRDQIYLNLQSKLNLEPYQKDTNLL